MDFSDQNQDVGRAVFLLGLMGEESFSLPSPAFRGYLTSLIPDLFLHLQSQ
jgi:hypothetical protein